MRTEGKIKQIAPDDSYYNGALASTVDWEKVELFEEVGFVAYVNINPNTVPEKYEIYTIVDDGFSNPRGIFKNAKKPFCTLLIDKSHKDKIPVTETQCYWLSTPSEVKFSREYYQIIKNGKMRKNRIDCCR